MASCIPLIERGKVIGLDGRPLEWAPLNAWQGFRIEIHPHMRRGQVEDRCNPTPLILIRLGARGASRIISGKSRFELALDDGQADVFAPGFQMDRGSWDCTPGTVIAIELHEPLLGDLQQQHGDRLSLRTSLAVRDPILLRLAGCIREEVEQGCPSGRLFADGLSLAVLGYLSSRYSMKPARPARPGRLTSAQLRVVSDHIEANLGSDLSVARLAGLIGLSPFHFSRMFKAGTGDSPYRFVLLRRVEAAKRLLRSNVSLSEIAYTVGFSSQSHFTSIFRRETGMTPGHAHRASGPSGGID